MSYKLVLNNELYHHGIKGQKWGVRRFQNPDGTLTAKGKRHKEIADAKDILKTAKNDYSDSRTLARKAAFRAVGIEGIQNSQKKDKQAYKDEMKVINAKANLAAAKAKDRKKEKAEFNSYRKQMQKSGIRGSVADINYRGRSTRIYNEVAKNKGKEYADRLEKSVQNRAMAEFVTGTAILAGTSFVTSYLISKNMY